MPVPSVAIGAQDELLRLSGVTGNPFETVTATGNGEGRYYGANKAFAVRPLVRVVTGTNPTLDVKLQVSADNVTWTDTGGVSLAQLTAASAAATLSFTTAPPYTLLNTPAGFPWVRMVKTIGGSATPTFTDFWLATEEVTPY